MKTIHRFGMTYKVIIRPWKRGDARYEVIKHPRNFPNFWERVHISEYRLMAQE